MHVRHFDSTFILRTFHLSPSVPPRDPFDRISSNDSRTLTSSHSSLCDSTSLSQNLSSLIKAKTRMSPHDPTNANAVAGSSKYPYNPDQASTTSTPGVIPPPPPNLPRIDPSGSAPPTEPIPVANQSIQQPRRRADGPIIVPTEVGSDGVREVPQLFEHCQVEDLIALIGKHCSLIPSRMYR